MNKIIVSICCQTYNHKYYIEQALHSFLMQKTNFEFEILLRDDASTDGTTEICTELANKFPNKISLLTYEENQFQKGVSPFKDNVKRAKGKYIALCEGDDYWTDPLKLQKQVDFLEANPDYVIHSGNALRLTENPELNGKPVFKSDSNNTLNLEDFLTNNFLVTCTIMFRNIDFIFPLSFRKVIFGDWFLYVILLKKTGGKAYRENAVFAVYRTHDGGVMSKLNSVNFLDAYIIQIISVYKFLGSRSLELKVMQILNGYSLQKYRLVLKDQKYYEALKTVAINFRYCRFSMPFRNYLSDFKKHLLHYKN